MSRRAPIRVHELVQHEAGPPPGGPGALPERAAAQALGPERCTCRIPLPYEVQIHPIFDEPTASEFASNARARAVPRVAGVSRVTSVPSIAGVSSHNGCSFPCRWSEHPLRYQVAGSTG